MCNKLCCSADAFSRRWGSLWSTCCGSSTVNSTEGEESRSHPPQSDSRTLASQGGVGTSSRPGGPQTSQSLPTLTSTLARPSEKRTQAARYRVKKVLRAPAPVFITTVQFARGGGVGGGDSVHPPAEPLLRLFLTKATVDFYTVMFSTQFKFPLKMRKSHHSSLDLKILHQVLSLKLIQFWLSFPPLSEDVLCIIDVLKNKEVCRWLSSVKDPAQTRTQSRRRSLARPGE